MPPLNLSLSTDKVKAKLNSPVWFGAIRATKRIIKLLTNFILFLFLFLFLLYYKKITHTQQNNIFKKSITHNKILVTPILKQDTLYLYHITATIAQPKPTIMPQPTMHQHTMFVSDGSILHG